MQVSGKWVGFGLGDVDPKVLAMKQFVHDKFQWVRDHTPALVLDNTFDANFEAIVSEMQTRYTIPATGIMNAATQILCGFYNPPPARRKIWAYSAPGSGANATQGPPFDTGDWIRENLGINHVLCEYPIGGYLGLMGGDPGLSYNDVIALEGAQLELHIASCPDLNDPDVEFWFLAYSQSADGMKVAVNRLFGDGGRFEHLRSRINGLILFGDPTRQPGPTKVGNNPVGWGISRKVFPQWINDLTWSITAETPGAPDFYAACDDEIRPLFYEEVVGASTSLSFFEHICTIIIPVLINLFTPFFGGIGALAGKLVSPLLAAATGVPLDTVTEAVGAAGPSSEDVDKKLIQLLSVQGVLTNIPALIHLLGALPGIATHGSYYDPKPEFGGRTGIQVACDIVRNFRR